jgi:IS30 family transposase
VRGEPVKAIAVRIGKSYQSVHQEIARNRKPDGRYQPWYVGLAAVVAAKLEQRWSPGQISRWLRCRYPRKPAWHVCTETIHDAVYRGLIVPTSPGLLCTVRTYRHRRGRGRSRDGALRQCNTMKPLRNRLPIAESRRQAGHWEGDLTIGAGQRSAIATLPLGPAGPGQVRDLLVPHWHVSDDGRAPPCALRRAEVAGPSRPRREG